MPHLNLAGDKRQLGDAPAGSLLAGCIPLEFEVAFWALGISGPAFKSRAAGAGPTSRDVTSGVLVLILAGML
jgi:hypothetical protein